MEWNYSELAAAAGTPSYIFSEQAFRERAEEVKKAFGERVDLCFSIKANPFLLSVLPDEFTRVEVCSPGELTICEKLGIDPDKIIFSGVNKSADDVACAISYGVHRVTIESLNHLAYADEEGRKTGKPVPVLIRLADESQFGIDEDVLTDIIARRDEYPGIKIKGIHYFTGTQKRRAKEVIKETERLSELTDSIREQYGFSIEELEYGAGLDADYFKPDAGALEAERLASVADAVAALGQKAHLTVEMGRFFAAPCGIYLTRVVDTKTNGGTNYAILDGGLHQLHYDGQFMGMQVPEIHHIKETRTADSRVKSARGTAAGPASADAALETTAWTLCGSLCSTNDVLARGAEFTDLAEGDILAFTRTGAYSHMEGMSIFLSRDLPKVWILASPEGTSAGKTAGTAGDLRLVRDRMEMYSYNMPFL